MSDHRRAVSDLTFGCRLQVDHGRLAIKISENEPTEQPGVRDGPWNDLDGDLGVLRRGDEPLELSTHDLATADVPVQHALVQDTPQVRSVEHRLPGQARGYLLVQVVLLAVGTHGEDRPRVVLGLERVRVPTAARTSGGFWLRLRCRPRVGTSRRSAGGGFS